MKRRATCPLLDSRALNASLASCTSVAQVLALHESHPAFNVINCATALSRIARALNKSTLDPSVFLPLVSRTIAVLRQTDCRPANGRTLTSIAHSLGILGRSFSGAHVADAALDVVTLAAAALPVADPDAPGALATLLWSFGSAGHVPHDSAAVAAAIDATAELVPRMSSAELTNAAWGVARVSVRAPALMAAIGAAAVSMLDERNGAVVTPQCIANLAWAWAKLRMRPPRALYTALVTAATQQLRTPGGAFERDSQALATLAWAFSRWPSVALNAAISNAAAAVMAAGRLATPTAVSLLQALGSGHAEGASAGTWAEPTAPGADPAVYSALAALALNALVSESTVRGTEHEQRGGVSISDTSGTSSPGLRAADIGLLAAVVSRGAAPLTAASAAAILPSLATHCEACAHALDWRGVAACELALRRLSGVVRCKPSRVTTRALCKTRTGTVAAKAMRKLADRAAAAAVEASAASDALAMLPSSLLLGVLGKGGLDETLHLLKNATGEDQSRRDFFVLLVGDDPEGLIESALTSRGCNVTHWRRYACDGAVVSDSPATAWPPVSPSIAQCTESGHLFDAAVVRVPPSSEGTAFVFDAVASVLQPAAQLVTFGLNDEGEGRIAETLGDAYSKWTLLASTSSGDASVRKCSRIASATPATVARGSFQAWRMTIDLSSAASSPVGPAPWVVYPGLFAGGGFDVMSAALLSSIPTPAPRARVLDFACGTGAIAATLLTREPSLRLTLLDADAVAVEAARENMRSAAHANKARCSARVYLADGLQGLPTSRLFDLIVSNPPVHRGSADNFCVLLSLLTEARSKLAPGGSLWIVSQAQVPVGRFAASVATENAIRMRPLVLADGRFVAWHGSKAC